MSTAHRAASLTDPDISAWTPAQESGDSAYNPERDVIVSRCLDLIRNNGLASGVVNTHVDNIIGGGLRLVANPLWGMLGITPEAAEEWGEQAETWFYDWANSPDCDAAGEHHLCDLAAMAYRTVLTQGEVLVLPTWEPDAGTEYATRIRLIDPDRLSNPDYRPDTVTLRGGIEYNNAGRRIAAHVQRYHPADVYALGVRQEWERIEFSTPAPWSRPRLLHLKAVDRPDAARGKPLLTPVLKDFKALGDYRAAELKAALVNAFVAIVEETELGAVAMDSVLAGDPAAMLGGLQAAQENDPQIKIQGYGAVASLPPGKTLKAFTPARPNQAYGPFVQAQSHHAAAGVGLTYELFTKDFSKANYSSIRAGYNEAWKHFIGRRGWFARYFYGPIYAMVMEEIIMTGRLAAPDFYRRRTAWCRAQWIGPGRGAVDVQKEAGAASERLRNQTSSLAMEAGNEGLDYRDVMRQQAKENRLRRELGLPIPGETPYTNQFNQPQQPPQQPPENTPETPANPGEEGDDDNGADDITT